MNQPNLFDFCNDAEVTGSVIEHCTPPVPVVPFIDEVMKETRYCWPGWEPIVGDGIKGLCSCGSCGIKTVDGETRYSSGMPMRILSIDVEKRHFIACGAYDPIAWPHLAEQHNDEKYILEIGDIWTPVDAINKFESWIDAGGPTSWFPPAPFDNWRDACPRTWNGVEIRNAIDFTTLPEYVEEDHSCFWCKSFWNVKHSAGGYCTCGYDGKLFKDKSMKERFPGWKPKRKKRRKAKK